MTSKSQELTLNGVNHIALVCKDMVKTVHFYQDILGMPLTTSFELPMNMGQHFFFDCGNGDSVAFFWFRGAPDSQPGINVVEALPGRGRFVTAHGSMNHLALNVLPEQFDGWHARLTEAGVDVTPIANHDHSESQIAEHVHDGVYVRSMYFRDPDGILLEIATWLKAPDGSTIFTEPRRAESLETH